LRLLIGYDGSDHSNFAIDDLQRAGLPPDVEAVVLTIGEAWELPMVVDRGSTTSEKFVHPNVAMIEEHLSEVSEKARILSKPAVSRLKGYFPGWSVRAEVRCGRPAVEIVKMADEWSPDLLVMGSQGRSAVGRVLLGSVSHKVLNDTRCSVRIARNSGITEAANARVMVAMDGSTNATAALQAVAKRKWMPGTEIRVVAVNDPFVRRRSAGYIDWNMAEDRPHDTEEAREWIRKVIDEPVEILRPTGCSISHTMRFGDAPNMIITEASEWQANSIFLGARGLGPVKRFVLGSVSSSVVSKARCSVEVVRESE
jgi:nucleotide-binding universal stress UspA family protein